jgi:xylan 1,4-beta-xylosidase
LKPVVVVVEVHTNIDPTTTTMGSSSKETVAATTFVHRWKRSFGSGHASLALRPDWRAHLVRAVDELGLGGVRYHGLFDDDNGPVVEIDHSTPGEFIYNWTLIDSTWDFLVAHSVKPVVELSFMPAFIANCSWHGHCPQDPLNCNGYACTQCSEGVLNGTAVINPTAPRCHSLEFHYQGIKQIPPRSDYSQWGTLVAALAKHAIKRYGADEVRTWNWEVWNEVRGNLWRSLLFAPLLFSSLLSSRCFVCLLTHTPRHATSHLFPITYSALGHGVSARLHAALRCLRHCAQIRRREAQGGGACHSGSRLYAAICK